MTRGHMFIYRSRFLTRGEVWFDDQPDGTGVDWIYHRQRSTPLPKHRSKPFYTLLVDLRKPRTQLLADMDARTASRIRQAQETDKLQCQGCDARDPKVLDQVEAMWNAFATAQNTPRLERSWLDQFSQAGSLDVVAAKNRGGKVLAYHLVYLAPRRARQLIAISPYQAVPSVGWRNAVSRANSLIHWYNFVALKERGIPCFDFGGWYPGSTDIRLLGMNAFKKGFGGKLVREFDCEQPTTLKGWIALTMAQWLTRFRRARPFAVAGQESKHDATQTEERKVSAAFR